MDANTPDRITVTSITTSGRFGFKRLDIQLPIAYPWGWVRGTSDGVICGRLWPGGRCWPVGRLVLRRFWAGREFDAVLEVPC